jgi:hypothetical protein
LRIVPSRGGDVGGEARGNHGEVHEAGLGHHEGREARHVGLALAQGFRAEQLQPLETVRDPALAKDLESGDLVRCRGDDHFSGHRMRDALFRAVLQQASAPLDAEPRFSGAGSVVDAGMNDAAVVRCLMKAFGALLLEQHETPVGPATQELPRQRQADDSAADDGDVVRPGQDRLPARPLRGPGAGGRSTGRGAVRE